jgi:hypothetical protein
MIADEPLAPVQFYPAERALTGMRELGSIMPTPVVSMVEHKGRLFVATTVAVWERGDDGVFRKCKFEMVP